MIYFNGAALEAVAPVKIEDIRVSPIQLAATAREMPVIWGSRFVRMTGGKRTIDISFGLLTNDHAARQAQLKAITQWARSDRPARLTLPYHDGVYLEAICTALPTPSTRQWWENLTLRFETFDNPYFPSVAEKHGPCNQALTILGDAPPIMRIEAAIDTEPVGGLQWAEGGHAMQFSIIPTGNLVIDLTEGVQTAAVDGVSIMQYFQIASTYQYSSFIIPHTGSMTIAGQGTVYWRERWE